MSKKIILSSFASLLFLSQAANSEIKIGKGSLTFNAGVSSQYIFRGIDNNKDAVTPFAGADFSHPAGDFNLYLGVYGAASDGVQTGEGGKEVDYYGGIQKSFGPATFDLGYQLLTWPSASAKADKNTGEFYIKLTIAPDKQPYTIGLAYYQDDTGSYLGADSTTKVDQDYKEVNATYNFGPAQGFVSYGELANDTKTTTVAISKELVGVGFTLSYISAEKDGVGSYIHRDREYVTLSAKKVF
jgi:uncharacterized protein (TIGR02001 family)